jgi:hypothetical protein
MTIHFFLNTKYYTKPSMPTRSMVVFRRKKIMLSLLKKFDPTLVLLRQNTPEQFISYLNILLLSTTYATICSF